MSIAAVKSSWDSVSRCKIIPHTASWHRAASRWLGAFFTFVACVGPSAAQEVIPLYDGPIAGAIEASDEESIRDPAEPYPFTQNVSRPTLTLFIPKGAANPTPAVIILPGGSYRGVSAVKEGTEVARKFNDIGIAAFVLKYRTPSTRHMIDASQGTLQDVRQALRVVRNRANEWRIDSRRIALMGFSAGGHAAAMAATTVARLGIGESEIPRHPDLLILIYPVISFLDPYVHATSRQQLLGENQASDRLRQFSVELPVTSQTPPTFIVHAADDKAVSVHNSLLFFAALKTNEVPAELHVYEKGGHGFGLRNATTNDSWFERCAAWLATRGWATATAK